MAVFIKGGGAYALNFAPRQCRLKHIAGIERTARTAGTHNGVYFVYKQNHIRRFLQFIHHRFHTLFKLAAVLGAGHQRGNIQRHNALVEQDPRYLLLDDAQGQALGYSRLTNTRLTNQNGVVFLAACQYLTHTLNFLLPAHNRIQLTVFSQFGKVPAEIIQHRCLALGFTWLLGCTARSASATE